MNKAKFATALALFAGFVGTATTSLRAQGEVLKQVAEAGSYCHIKFPAIREETLSAAAPDLTASGDVIDFYGPCNHDPLGEDEVQSQKLQLRHKFDAESD